jgi:microcystin-dependent protein
MINMILGQVQINPNTEIFKTDDNGEIILDENKNPTVIDYIPAVSIEVWKALVFYCQVFKGTLRNSPINFSLGSADALSRTLEDFPEFIRWALEDSGRLLKQTLSWYSNDYYHEERCLQLILTQETLDVNEPDKSWWTGQLRDRSEEFVCTGFRPLPAQINLNNTQENFSDYVMLFFEEGDNPAEPTVATLTGNLTAFISKELPEWQRHERSMRPEIMNPEFIYNGVQEGNFLDQSTINGFFNRVANGITGLYAKSVAMHNTITSLLGRCVNLARRIKQAEFDITTITDFNAVGCIVQFVGEMDEEQLRKYMLCDGREIPQSASWIDPITNNKPYEHINRLMWAMEQSKTNGTENFNLEKKYRVPDLRGYFLVGASNGQATQDARTKDIALYEKGGEAEHKLEEKEMPKHIHAYSGREGQASGWGSGGNSNINYGAKTRETEETGENEPHNNMPPYFSINYYIRVLK